MLERQFVSKTAVGRVARSPARFAMNCYEMLKHFKIQKSNCKSNKAYRDQQVTLKRRIS
jgi:hypothetical protein